MKLFKKWSNWELVDTICATYASGRVDSKYEIYKRTREDGLVKYKQIKVYGI